jgi:antitoxin (DNA-binding transcriptional repressor) of toxin-antitoxin stability system
MPAIDTTPLPEIGTDAFRAHLRHYLDQVTAHRARLLLCRRGQPLAGLVPVAEARALWRVAHESEQYAEWKMLHRLNQDRALRRAMLEEADAERRAAPGTGG